MFDVINNILTNTQSIISFLTSSITAMLSLLKAIPEYLTFMTDSIQILPPIVLPFIYACLAVYVIFLIVGR